MSSKFTEKETETYYDSQDAIYRAFWDEDGSVHWGVFDDNTGDDFLKACANLNDMMVDKGRINSSSKVLDMVLALVSGEPAMRSASSVSELAPLQSPFWKVMSI